MKTQRRLYALTPLPHLNAEQCKGLDPSYAGECFRVEFLLRSEALRELYRRDRKQTGKALRETYKIQDGWKILEGSHHAMLRPHPKQWFFAPGLLNLSAMAKDLDGHQATIRDSQFGFLYVGIDPRLPPLTLWNGLKPLLAQRRTKLREQGPWIATGTGSATIPQFQDHLPYDYQTWTQYLRCYDLSIEGKKPAEIGKDVYGEKGSPAQRRDNVKKAIKRVRAAITKVVAVK